MMYQEVYEEMVKGGIAVKLDAKSCLSKDGEMVDKDDEAAFGLPTEYRMVRPDKMLFVDEVGSNTSQNFTVLGFTAATGVPLMCAIIFAAKEMEESWVLGFDPEAEWIGDIDNIEANAGGRGKRYPMGPTCVYNGISVPAFCCCSENGSITAELLVDMLSFIDGIGVFDRSDRVPPFLLLDGHGSRFDNKFLEYINEPATQWNVCIGVPYGTSYWQVGDSTEQNGCFKMALTKHKRNLTKKKESRGAEFAIDKDDVVDLVGRAWDDSFARIGTNKKAVADRGWSPLNYNCLLHPAVVSTTTAAAAAVIISPGELNLNHGLAGTLVDSIVEVRMRDDARNGINLEENRRKREQTALDAISSKKRYTAGLHVASGRFLLGPQVLTDVQEKKRQQHQGTQ